MDEERSIYVVSGLCNLQQRAPANNLFGRNIPSLSRLAPPLLGLFLCGFLQSYWSPGGFCASHSGEDKPTKQPDVRTLHFPADKSIGALMFIKRCNDNPDSWETFTSGQQFAGARGTVKVTVPPRTAVMFEANRRVFENPALLKEVSPYGVDILKLSFISLEDREDNLFGRTIDYISNLQGLKVLYVDRSEATDADLAKLKNLPHLCSINCFLSSINGACFKNFASLPELYEISAMRCNIDQKNLEYLSQIRKLNIIDLASTHIDERGAKSIGKCTGLIQLSLGGNPKFDDNCLKYLLALRNLRYLDVRDTAVTIKGIRTLHALKLKKLIVPNSMNSNLAELRVMFPGVNTWANKQTTLTSEDKKLYAPLR